MADKQVRRLGRPNKSGKPYRPNQSPESREQARQRRKVWAKTNREKFNEYMREWSKENREKKRQTDTRWRINNPEKAAQRNRISSRNHRAAKRQAQGFHTNKDIARIMEDQHWRCAYCRRLIRKNHHVDHIIPLSKGGSNWPKNLQLTCEACNFKKNANDPIDFAKRIGLLL